MLGRITSGSLQLPRTAAHNSELLCTVLDFGERCDIGRHDERFQCGVDCRAVLGYEGDLRILRFNKHNGAFYNTSATSSNVVVGAATSSATIGVFPIAVSGNYPPFPFGRRSTDFSHPALLSPEESTFTLPGSANAYTLTTTPAASTCTGLSRRFRIHSRDSHGKHRRFDVHHKRLACP